MFVWFSYGFHHWMQWGEGSMHFWKLCIDSPNSIQTGSKIVLKLYAFVCNYFIEWWTTIFYSQLIFRTRAFLNIFTSDRNVIKQIATKWSKIEVSALFWSDISISTIFIWVHDINLGEFECLLTFRFPRTTTELFCYKIINANICSPQDK